jgi:hypothetical protein
MDIFSNNKTKETNMSDTHKRTHSLGVKTGEYTGQNGEKKNRYLYCGAIVEGEYGPYLLIDKSFNPAGVQQDNGYDSVRLSMWPVNDAPHNNNDISKDDDFPF